MGQFILINKGKEFLKSKRSQAWSFDLVMAGFIFLVGIILLYVYAINYSLQPQQHMDQLFYEGSLASELILSEEDFGILTDNEINQTKLDQYDTNYTMKRGILGVTHDFYFVMDGSLFGKENTTEIDDLIQVTRIIVYKDKPTKFEFFIYD